MEISAKLKDLIKLHMLDRYKIITNLETPDGNTALLIGDETRLIIVGIYKSKEPCAIQRASYKECVDLLVDLLKNDPDNLKNKINDLICFIKACGKFKTGD